MRGSCGVLCWWFLIDADANVDGDCRVLNGDAECYVFLGIARHKLSLKRKPDCAKVHPFRAPLMVYRFSQSESVSFPLRWLFSGGWRGNSGADPCGRIEAWLVAWDNLPALYASVESSMTVILEFTAKPRHGREDTR
ncbi:hypothetical protein FOZG_14775 [Fusarium oxysporum Fo47]|jgi:hypothetical protein|uniref:Secreted protein n=1 Tax=Fusarium oxysporum Fo47 TaxID=660027 RepID=W9JMC5_FUSOX|nr:hypothetical protein FOZG_14775 [Fusarium oxysporum Fo47]